MRGKDHLIRAHLDPIVAADVRGALWVAADEDWRRCIGDIKHRQAPLPRAIDQSAVAIGLDVDHLHEPPAGNLLDVLILTHQRQRVLAEAIRRLTASGQRRPGHRRVSVRGVVGRHRSGVGVWCGRVGEGRALVLTGREKNQQTSMHTPMVISVSPRHPVPAKQLRVTLTA